MLFPAWADGGTPEAVAEPTAQPVRVAMGVFLLRIDALDLKAETADVTFYVWTRWKGDVDGAAYELMNGTIQSKESEYKFTGKDGTQYAYYRIRATLNVAVDFKRFPFDTHLLSIEFEHPDNGTTTLLWEVDSQAMKHLPAPQRSGWSIGAPTSRVTEHAYKTNWGMMDTSPDETTFSSRFIASIELRHEASATFRMRSSRAVLETDDHCGSAAGFLMPSAA